MLLVDPRAGSCNLHPQLMARGLPSALAPLEYGDCSFLGYGPTGMTTIGIEYKRTTDALACMTDGRLAGHQLPGMLQTYQHCWLLIEGITRCGIGNGSEGVLQVQGWPEGWKDYRQGSRFVMWRDYQHWLMSLQQQAGVLVAHTANLRESAAWVAALYSWWQKPWHEHKSVGAIYVPPIRDTGGPLASVIHGKPSLSRLWALSLPGIGDERSKTVALAFPTALELATATEARWQIAVGQATGSQVYNAIREYPQ